LHFRGLSRHFCFARASLGALGLALAACGDDASATGDAGASDAGASDLDVATDAGPFRFDGGFSARPDASFAYPLDDTLSIFHAQLEATHNSDHLRPESTLIDWQYEHAPLDVQLEEQGVRGLELDVHWEPRLGAHRVFHLTRVDARCSCELFVECLASDLRGARGGLPRARVRAGRPRERARGGARGLRRGARERRADREHGLPRAGAGDAVLRRGPGRDAGALQPDHGARGLHGGGARSTSLSLRRKPRDRGGSVSRPTSHTRARTSRAARDQASSSRF
jgi:hypothetical protein